MFTAAMDILFAQSLLDNTCHCYFYTENLYRTDFLLVTRPSELSALTRTYSLPDPCLTKAKEAQKRSALRARHVMAPHWEAFSRWKAYAAKLDKTRTRSRCGGLFSEDHPTPRMQPLRE